MSSNDFTRQALAERDRRMTPRERMLECLDIGFATQDWVEHNRTSSNDFARQDQADRSRAMTAEQRMISALDWGRDPSIRQASQG